LFRFDATLHSFSTSPMVSKSLRFVAFMLASRFFSCVGAAQTASGFGGVMANPDPKTNYTLSLEYE
jgi:hypothetical protein